MDKSRAVSVIITAIKRHIRKNNMSYQVRNFLADQFLIKKQEIEHQMRSEDS